MPLRTCQASGRTGMYLEVTQPGVIQAGDAVAHVGCGIERITVPDLARFFMNPQPDPLELDRPPAEVLLCCALPKGDLVLDL